MKVAVISSTITYYPIDPEKQAKIQPIYQIVMYIKKTVDSGLDYIAGNNQTIVFQFWNNILFLICGKSKSPEFLRYQLEIVKNVTTFLFGPQFETNMLTLIDVSKCRLFAKYIDTYLDFCNRFYQLPYGIVEYSPTYRIFSRIFSQKIPVEKIPNEIHFVESIILCDHKVISRTSNNSIIDSTSFLMLYLTAYINHEDPEYFNDREVNTEYTTRPDSYRHKKGFLKINGNLSQYVISTVRFGEHSPYLAIFITENIEQQDLVHSIVSLFANYVSENLYITDQISTQFIPGTVRYTLINRTTGESWDHKMQNMDKQSEELTNVLLSSMKSKVFEALVKGYHYMMWYDELFLFTYQQLFVLPNGEILQPKQTRDFPGKTVRFNYQYIAQRMFPSQKNINVYECYAIFLKTISPKDAQEISQKYFGDFLYTKQTKQMQNKKRSSSTSMKKRSQSDLPLGYDKNRNQKLVHAPSTHNVYRGDSKPPLPSNLKQK
ncbi:hypothetical protein GPJ56_001487 [Histomonas meleagridis]|uniref:uncharacterized protein n=1 Tax=Histomonas meleagridis TaxID=135588 RepID=UPI0035596C04|nr:hypothetical protein GPJ56_001487 [Histomonas meleagridis]KAH0806993.1 hypothetical protein GO595_000169 [Histomonas meleagridis]